MQAALDIRSMAQQRHQKWAKLYSLNQQLGYIYRQLVCLTQRFPKADFSEIKTTLAEVRFRIPHVLVPPPDLSVIEASLLVEAEIATGNGVHFSQDVMRLETEVLAVAAQLEADVRRLNSLALPWEKLVDYIPSLEVIIESEHMTGFQWFTSHGLDVATASSICRSAFGMGPKEIVQKAVEVGVDKIQPEDLNIRQLGAKRLVMLIGWMDSLRYSLVGLEKPASL